MNYEDMSIKELTQELKLRRYIRSLYKRERRRLEYHQRAEEYKLAERRKEFPYASYEELRDSYLAGNLKDDEFESLKGKWRSLFSKNIHDYKFKWLDSQIENENTLVEYLEELRKIKKAEGRKKSAESYKKNFHFSPYGRKQVVIYHKKHWINKSKYDE